MSGKKKIGLDFFYHDVASFQDIKIRKLIKRQGSSAYTVYICLLCEIYRHSYYIECDDELPFFVSEQTGADEEYCLDVIKACLNIGLFEKKMFNRYQVLTSQRIQEHYDTVNRQAKRTATIDKYRLISSEEKVISSEDMQITSENMVISSKKSGRNALNKNKSKIKEISSSPISPSPLTRRGGRKEEGDIILSTIKDKPQPEADQEPAPTKASASSDLSKVQVAKPASSGNTYFGLYQAMKGKIGETDAKCEEDTIWECVRLTNGGRVDSIGVPLIRVWLEQTDEQKRRNPFYYLLQNLQKMEREGTIHCDFTHKEYFMYRWLKLNLSPNEYRQASALCKSNTQLHPICQDCIKEISSKGDAIKYPGKFIISRLKEPTTRKR